jgi:tryptophan synthase alpha subunit
MLLLAAEAEVLVVTTSTGVTEARAAAVDEPTPVGLVRQGKVILVGTGVQQEHQVTPAVAAVAQVLLVLAVIVA